MRNFVGFDDAAVNNVQPYAWHQHIAPLDDENVDSLPSLAPSRPFRRCHSLSCPLGTVFPVMASLLGRLFRNPHFHAPFLRTLGYSSQGGSEIGEAFVTAERIINSGSETRRAWWEAWSSMARFVQVGGEESLARGHFTSARASLLRATEYYRASTAFSDSTDLNTRAAYHNMRSCYEHAADIAPLSVVRTIIPVATSSGTIDVPIVYHQCAAARREPRPTVLAAADDFLEETEFSVARPMLERSFNVLTFEGPGQGRLLRDSGLPMRTDGWGEIAEGLIKWCEAREDVDSSKLVLFGRGFGSYAASKAASHDSVAAKVAALVLDPGATDPESMLQGAIDAAGSPDFLELYRKADLTGIDHWYRTHVSTPSDAAFEEVPGYDALDMRRFYFEKRFVAFGSITLSSYLSSIKAFDAAAFAGQIRCPVLICTNDSIPAVAQRSTTRLLDSLNGTRDKMILAFDSRRGEFGDCQPVGHEAFYRQVSYWLKDVLFRNGRWEGERKEKVAASV
ncbi:Alpha/Beta hydrolase protein [Hyaloraphidium curvatum]|nr:Alpha/Beta hydrolase protein [Hyaloraphidium curvatum]